MILKTNVNVYCIVNVCSTKIIANVCIETIVNIYPNVNIKNV